MVDFLARCEEDVTTGIGGRASDRGALERVSDRGALERASDRGGWEEGSYLPELTSEHVGLGFRWVTVRKL